MKNSEATRFRHAADAPGGETAGYSVMKVTGSDASPFFKDLVTIRLRPAFLNVMLIDSAIAFAESVVQIRVSFRHILIASRMVVFSNGLLVVQRYVAVGHFRSPRIRCQSIYHDSSFDKIFVICGPAEFHHGESRRTEIPLRVTADFDTRLPKLPTTRRLRYSSARYAGMASRSSVMRINDAAALITNTAFQLP